MNKVKKIMKNICCEMHKSGLLLIPVGVHLVQEQLVIPRGQKMSKQRRLSTTHEYYFYALHI